MAGSLRAVSATETGNCPSSLLSVEQVSCRVRDEFRLFGLDEVVRVDDQNFAIRHQISRFPVFFWPLPWVVLPLHKDNGHGHAWENFGQSEIQFFIKTSL